MYSKKTISHFRNPKYAGEIKNPDGVGEEGNVKCGDVLRIFIQVKNNKITNIKFLTYGCVAAIAATDALCGIAKGKTLEQASKLTFKDIIKNLGELPPIKYHCSVMGVEALRKAIEDYREKNKKEQ